MTEDEDELIAALEAKAQSLPAAAEAASAELAALKASLQRAVKERDAARRAAAEGGAVVAAPRDFGPPVMVRVLFGTVRVGGKACTAASGPIAISETAAAGLIRAGQVKPA